MNTFLLSFDFSQASRDSFRSGNEPKGDLISFDLRLPYLIQSSSRINRASKGRELIPSNRILLIITSLTFSNGVSGEIKYPQLIENLFSKWNFPENPFHRSNWFFSSWGFI